MPNNADATDDTETTQEGEGSTGTTGTDSTQNQEGSDQAAQVASARKRQAGAEAARQVAEASNKELIARLAKYESDNQTAAQKDLSELAKQTTRADAAEKRAQDAEAKADARVLDTRFPNARKELPEVTDEVRLAKFEALLADGEEDSPTPLRHNGTTRSGTTAGTPKVETAADVAARLQTMPLPVSWT